MKEHMRSSEARQHNLKDIKHGVELIAKHFFPLRIDFTHLASPKSATFTTFSTPTRQFLAAKSR